MTDPSDSTPAPAAEAAQDHPNQHFVNVVLSACAGPQGRANRAQLRRALRRCNDAPLDVLRIIGPALSHHDTADDMALKVGVAGLYAAHGHDLSGGTPWRTIGHVLRSKSTSDRNGRELQKLKHRLDRGDVVRAMEALRLMLDRLDDAAVATLDWGLLLTDLRNLLHGRHDPRAQKVWHRWCVAFARGDDNTDDAPPAPDTSAAEPAA